MGELHREGVGGFAFFAPSGVFIIWEILISNVPCYFQRENTVSMND